MCGPYDPRDQNPAEKLSNLVMNVTGHYVRPEGLSLLITTEWTRLTRLAHLIHGSKPCADADDMEVKVEAELARTAKKPDPRKQTETGPAKPDVPVRIAVERNGSVQLYNLNGHIVGEVEPGEVIPLVKAK
jgi:hypothetical protein